MIEPMSGKAGLVLAGAVAQGGFDAGAVEMLAEKHPEIASRIARVAGTSSGALNAAVIAVGAATGQLRKAARVLRELWIEDGSLSRIARLRILDWPHLWLDRAHLRGVLETAQLQALVEKAIGEVMTGWNGVREAVTLTLVTTNLNGLGGPRGPVPLPVYEQPITFDTDALVDAAGRRRIAHAAAASATFPALFVPTAFDGSPCIDGGAVNNAPLSYVLRDPKTTPRGDRTKKPDVDTVVVVTAESAQLQKVIKLGGDALAARVASALIDERIAYDLAQTVETNARYESLRSALEGITETQKEKILAAAGCWPVKLYLVQPGAPLEGDAFSGFLHKDLRQGYVDAGRNASLRQL